MPLETNGFDGLMTDIAGMASRMDADGSGAPVAKRILEAAAQPIHQQMKANATKDPRRRSGDLHDALKVGSVRRSKKRGRHITIGENFFCNYNCVMLDCAPITFGNNVMVAPNCGFYTAAHPLDHTLRDEELEYAKPITVGDSVWIGGGVTVLPGVTIGSRAVIGGGSVVVHDIPEGVVAVGNPCRPIRTL